MRGMTTRTDDRLSHTPLPTSSRPTGKSKIWKSRRCDSLGSHVRTNGRRQAVPRVSHAEALGISKHNFQISAGGTFFFQSVLGAQERARCLM